MFNRNHHSGMMTGLDAFGSMFSGSGGIGELTWSPNANLAFSDNVYFINGVVTSIGGANNNFTDKNTWTLDFLDGVAVGWKMSFPMPGAATTTNAVMFGAAISTNNAANFNDISYGYYFNGIVTGDIYIYEDGLIKVSQSGVPEGTELEIRKNLIDATVNYYIGGTAIPFYTSLTAYTPAEYKIKISSAGTTAITNVKTYMNI